MHSAARRSISRVVMPGLMWGVMASSTSAARRQAVRIAWMPSTSLYVMLIGGDYPRGARAPQGCAGGPGAGGGGGGPEKVGGLGGAQEGGPQPAVSHTGITVTLHITEFEGGRALSEFRIRQLLPRLREVHDKVEGLSARFIHLAAWD